ncbi:uncharacterized protein LOC125212494 isoform X2 [Salvia hispanica]|uniref:uncharacterized protein LOC125212494 isoform X2 n=1 Tax=Salvia hispanica TaxID=49212 RepID=UPI002009030E|nr:uncharacterized protein LOC125212494 isoform X2 [Salvia hispanica]
MGELTTGSWKISSFQNCRTRWRINSSVAGVSLILLAINPTMITSTGSGQFKHWAALLGIREPIFQPVVAFYCLYYRFMILSHIGFTQKCGIAYNRESTL